jgi:hypothetical protein
MDSENNTGDQIKQDATHNITITKKEKYLKKRVIQSLNFIGLTAMKTRQIMTSRRT